MSAVPAGFPALDIVADWRRSFENPPHTAWLANLDVGHLHAVVELDEDRPLDRFAGMVLASLADSPRGIEDINARLRLGAPLLRQALKPLVADGLAHAEAGSGWRLSKTGALARRQGSYRPRERRSFFFVERPGRPPHFLPLQSGVGLPRETTDREIVAHLEACLGQPADWKEKHGFPADVKTLIREAEPSADAIIVIEGLQVPLFLLQQDDSLHGWLFNADTDELGRRPVLMLGPSWREALPMLEQSLPVETWRLAWDDWCRSRRLGKLEAANIEVSPHGIRVSLNTPYEVPAETLQQLPYLFAGADRVAALLPLEIVSS